MAWTIVLKGVQVDHPRQVRSLLLETLAGAGVEIRETVTVDDLVFDRQAVDPWKRSHMPEGPEPQGPARFYGVTAVSRNGHREHRKGAVDRD